MLPTPPSRVLAVALAVLAIACGDPTKPKATFANELTPYTLHAFTGAPVTAATAINFLSRSGARADANFAFDVAFDLDATGQPLVYPVRAIASDLAGTVKRVGLQVVPGAFDAVREVPETGYDTLSVQKVSTGQVLAVEMFDLQTCAFSLGGQLLHAKLTVDSVNTTSRRIYARAVLDLNCGYRSVVADSVPTI
jgi:hypothetical protein